MPAKFTTLITALLMLTSLIGTSHTPPHDDWEWGNPYPQGNYLSAVAWGDDRFVGVGFYGATVHSRDGETWHAQIVDPSLALTGITYGNKRFVAVGYTLPTAPVNLVALTSADGTTWTRWDGTAGRFEGVAFGQDLFVAVGPAGIYTSRDGRTWEEVWEGGWNWPQAVAYGGGRFVAVGSDTVLTSEDGQTWTDRSADAELPNWYTNLVSVVYGDGQFAAVDEHGQILTSADGLTWVTHKSIPLPFRSVGYGKGRFVASAGGNLMTSVDGARWEHSRHDIGSISGFAEGGGRFVGVGRDGEIFSTTDGTTWNEHSSALYTTFQSVAHGGERFVAAGWRYSHPGFWGRDPRRTGLLVSQDGIRWTVPATRVDTDLNEVVFGNGVFVAVGEDVYTSVDGEHWEALPDESVRLYSVTFGGGLFVGARYHPATIFTSADGQSWQPHPLPHDDGEVYAFAWGNGRFVGVGRSQRIIVSTDGASWTTISAPVRDLWDVVYGQDQFVAVGVRGKVLTSADGLSWTVHELDSDLRFLHITYGDGWYLAADGLNPYLSQDGVTWTQLPRVTGQQISGLAYAGGRYFALGREGVILSRKGFEGKR